MKNCQVRSTSSAAGHTKLGLSCDGRSLWLSEQRAEGAEPWVARRRVSAEGGERGERLRINWYTGRKAGSVTVDVQWDKKHRN